jgi:hypothetical protein
MTSSVKTRVTNWLICDAGLSIVEQEKETNLEQIEAKILVNVFKKADKWRASNHWALKEFNATQQQEILSQYDSGKEGESSPGKRIWNKWKSLKRTMLKVDLPIWVRLHVNGIAPSGKSHEDLILLHREAVWKMVVPEEAQKKKAFCANTYWPAQWECFICFGPPAKEKQSPVFKAEMSNGPKRNAPTKPGKQVKKILGGNGMYSSFCCVLHVHILIMRLYIQRNLDVTETV